ncbi:UNVERIFIED_CONTAM: putative ribonuclease H protein [Sesamum radiatum]|uniref:Ribonuclease H protein n=1 Tax=Sesamum radiatum TaxID=300843 RepID=A0AAW2THS1_SESRA
MQLPTRVSDFQPIACCNMIYKDYPLVGMQHVLHKLIDESQTAFVPGHSISDNVLLAQELLAGYNRARLPPRCTVKVDFQKAYNSGIRQGDPMCPYLFVIVMELWHVLLKIRVQNTPNFIYHWKCREVGSLNLCFADDVLVFCSGNPQSVRVIKCALAEFAELSGLRANLNKSQIILSRAIREERQTILDDMGFPEGSLPFAYLRVPLVASRLKVADCQALSAKIDNRLAGWGHLNLLFAGRQGSSGRGYAKMSWLRICSPKKEGRLGIRRVLHLNQALMLKQVWRILQEDEQSIWVQWVLIHRLRTQTMWVYHSSTATWCWKKLLKLNTLLLPGLEYRIGDGRKFRLWIDLWHPRGPLIRCFPRGPAITGLPADSLLMAMLHQGQWNWPSEMDFDIQEIISGLPDLSSQQSDMITWRLHPGKFTTVGAVAFLHPPSPHVLWHQLLGGKFKIPRH